MKYIKKFNESNTGEQTSNEILERSYNNWISDFEKGLDNKKLFALADTIAMTSRSSNPQAWLDKFREFPMVVNSIKREHIKIYLEKRKKLINEFDYLLYKYREYQEYFIGRTPQEAEMKYYSDMFDQSGYDSEGLFSLNHTFSLKDKMDKNRQERNKISLEIKELKSKIRNLKNSK